MNDEQPKPRPVAAVLAEARGILTPPGVWIQGTNAEDAIGFARKPDHPLACRFCSAGAINRADGGSHYNPSPAVQVLARAIGDPQAEALPYSVVAIWNDAPSRTVAEVLAMFKKAEEMARSEVDEKPGTA